MRFTPPKGTKLAKYWPRGVTGEVIHENEFNVHLLVKLSNNSGREPHTVTIVADWKHVKEVEQCQGKRRNL
ncbi:MAG: hypothetical protein LUQ50_12270 [Methanospirillum sp.]|uniref:hypothetical protein n=1 Tax=Methanospirillum sp. TaxID=45200 RepID=UPI002373CF64|nr:hypothetical protein [Methanospirillum sp.]MDD1729832.1 hypothetical protein [Methanospirillum sp.]